MAFSDTNVFARDDTFFGACQAIGEDLGFNPNYLRIAFAVPLLVAPVQTVAAYFGLAIFVLALRLLVPEPRRAAASAAGTDPLPDEAAAFVPEAETEESPVAVAA